MPSDWASRPSEMRGIDAVSLWTAYQPEDLVTCIERVTVALLQCVLSAVRIVNRYGMDGPGIEFRWGQDFPHPSKPVPSPPNHL